ncbi:MAG: hypothetical protein GPJ54_01720 [Candidatus Heimdallarchaeota archaeon]|nr:hypothetical protein [Candidatus Heimdallarchaeota archaeon]
MSNTNESRIPELVDELSSYLYGVFFLASLSALMLILHIGISIFFHN